MMDCRAECGACCIAPSISSPMPGMPDGKAAGERCLHLDEKLACGLWGDPRRPQVCADFKPEFDICGRSRHDALQRLAFIEEATHVRGVC